MPGLNASPVASVATARPPQNALLRGVLGKLSLKDVRNAPSFSRCQLGRTPGVHERKTHGHAIGYAHDVMKEAMQNASRKDAAALARTLELLGDGTNDNLGPVLLVHLTAIGAVREGVAALLRDSPNDQKLATHLKQLDDAIVKTGIKTGKCELAEPDAVYLAQYPSTEKVCDAVAAGKKVMTHCAAKIGGPALLAGIAQAVLPQAMMDSLAERLPELVNRFMQPEGEPEWSEVLQSQAAWHLNKVLKAQLESGGTEDLQSAVIQLLKTPEYILRSQRGGEGDDSEGLKRPDVPADAPAWVKQGVKDGAPILYNVVNCGGNSSANSHRCGMQLEHIRNLLNDAREDAYERGRLTEVVRFQEHHIDRLERELQAARERNGPGEVRERRLQKERLNNASMDATPLDEVLDPIPDRPAARVPVDRTHAGNDQVDNTVRNRQRQEKLNKPSDSTLPPDDDLDPIKPDDRARAQPRNHTGGTDRIDDSTQQRRDPVQYPSNRVVPPGGGPDRTPDQENGGGLVRRKPGGEDQTDRSNRTPPQNLLQHASSSVVPPSDELGDLPPLNNDLARANVKLDESDRTDTTDHRVQQQRVGDGQQWLRRQPVANRTPGAGAPAGDGGPMAEFKLYLQALRIEQNPPLHDPFPTTSPRMYFANDTGMGNAPEPVRTLSARDFTLFRNERSRMSGVPFAPPSTGPVRDRVEAPRDEFIDLIARRGTGQVTPADVLERNHLRPASPTPMVIREPDSELERAFTSLRKRNMESSISGAARPTRAASPRAPARQPYTPSATPATPRSSVSSLDSVRSSAGSIGSLRDQILAGARTARGGQSNAMAFNDALEFAHASPLSASSNVQAVADEAKAMQRPTSAHMVALELAVQQIRRDREAGVYADAARASSETEQLESTTRGRFVSAAHIDAPLKRAFSQESKDSGNASPTRLEGHASELKSPRLVAAIERQHKRNQQRVPQLDISITQVRHVDEKGVPLRGPALAQAAPASAQAALMEDLQATLQQRASRQEAS